MPDELDYISERTQLELDMRIQAEREKKVDAPKGTCLQDVQATVGRGMCPGGYLPQHDQEVEIGSVGLLPSTAGCSVVGSARDR